MALKLSEQYDHLIQQFYRIAALRHPQREANALKLKGLIEDIGWQSEKQQSGKEKERGSMMTQCSLTQVLPSIPTQKTTPKVENILLYTFYPHSQHTAINKKKETFPFKYRSPSLTRILLYAIVFNHHSMDTLAANCTVSITHVLNLNKSNIDKIKHILTNIITQKRTNPDSKVQLQINTLNNLLADLSVRREKHDHRDPKEIIQSIDDSIIEEVFTRLLIYRVKQPASNKTPLLQSKSIEKRAEKRKGETVSEHALSQVAQKLQVRVKIQSGEGKQSWGEHKGPICFNLKRSRNRVEYYLKEISYYPMQEQGSPLDSELPKEKWLQ